jgi:hypothetical protein
MFLEKVFSCSFSLSNQGSAKFLQMYDLIENWSPCFNY